MKKNPILILLSLCSLIIVSDYAKADYLLIIGTYRQGPGGRPEVSGITSPSLHSIPMKDLDTCEKQEKKLQMKYISQFGNLIVNGLVYLAAIINKFIF